MRNLIAGLLILLTSCAGKNQGINSMPPCLAAKIEGMKSDPKHNVPESVTEYSYKGQRVFYITMPCCDQFNEVYDMDCKYLGAPDGGIEGKGDRKLPDFSKEATGAKVIWKK